MTGLVLVVNAGSATLKYQLVDVGSGSSVAKGLVDRIGRDDATLQHHAEGQPPVTRQCRIADHGEALSIMIEVLTPLPELVGVGHRVVHGGARFTEPTLIDADVEAGIEDLIPLAPLHNPANLAGIRALRALLPDVPQVAVFDTAFHATIPAVAATYAIPTELAALHGVRRYGFHGTSCRYVTGRAAAELDIPPSRVNLLVCHLGNGASVTAIASGRSVDTSMGMSPLAGLVMGTRSGDIDPAIPFHLERVAGLDAEHTEDLLTRASGLLGLAGSADMREVRTRADAGDQVARQARAVYAYRIRHYLGAYHALVPGLDAFVFTAGVGENDDGLRADVCGPLAHLGIRLDPAANAAAVGGAGPVRIDDGTGPARVLVVPTNEEAEIAAETAQVVGDRAGP